MLIKACLNGGTSREVHPAVPRTPDELAADALAARLTELGIPVEAGVWTPDDADMLAAARFGRDVIRVLIEPQDDDPDAAVAAAARIEETLDRHDLQAPRLHHGYGTGTWH